jgi:hypothetical protein
VVGGEETRRARRDASAHGTGGTFVAANVGRHTLDPPTREAPGLEVIGWRGRAGRSGATR